MSDYIPAGVLLNIITTLPIKTLVRCTCVCKSWHSLITGPSFITTHLNRPTAVNDSNTRDLMFVQSCSVDGDKEHYSLHHNNEAFGEFMNLELPFIQVGNIRIVGSSNGLICLSNDRFPYMESHFFLSLWNPSIRKCLPLPTVRVGFKSHGPFAHTIGFGFDPVTNDYKVVRVVYLDCVEIPPEVDIFTLSTGVWRNISHLGLRYLIDERTPQAYLKRAIHWFAFDRDNVSANKVDNLIVCFDISDEVFREIRLPSSMSNERCLRVRVANYQESLCVMHSDGLWDPKQCVIWVMKEYGVVESWTKQFRIDFRNPVKSIAGFRRNGELLLGMKGRRLSSYDPKTKKIKDLGIHGPVIESTKYLFNAHAYTESLVLFGVKACDAVTSDGSDKESELWDLPLQVEDQVPN